MCAAPGSKTAQLIEMIHADEGNILPGNKYSIILMTVQISVINFCSRGFCDSQ